MEEFTEEAVADSPDASVVPARKFVWALPAGPALSRRQVLIAVTLLAVVAGAAVGGVAYRAHAKQKQAVAALTRQQAEHDAAARAEALAAARERRRMHEEIMVASPPAAALPLPAELLGGPVGGLGAGLSAALSGGPSEKAAAVRQDAATRAAGSANVATVPTPLPVPPASAKGAPATPVPAAGGGCALSGQAPGDYGKALGRCLEEFNRLEGRKG